MHVPITALFFSFFHLAWLHFQGKTLALFQIGTHFWAHENRCPNSDRSTKDIILILFNSPEIDLNNETRI